MFTKLFKAKTSQSLQINTLKNKVTHMLFKPIQAIAQKSIGLFVALLTFLASFGASYAELDESAAKAAVISKLDGSSFAQFVIGVTAVIIGLIMVKAGQLRNGIVLILVVFIILYVFNQAVLN